MDTVQALLERLDCETDPRNKWLLLEQANSTLQEDAAVQTRRLWWQARYLFMDKKKTLVRDRFVWLFMICKGESRSRPRKHDPIAKEYRETLCSPQLTAAMEQDDCLWAHLLDAAKIYADTLRQPPSFLGFARSAPSQQEVNVRVASEITGTLLNPLAQRCEDAPYLDLVLRALYEGAKASHPGIQPDLLANIEQAAPDSARRRITAAIRNPDLNGY